ncbi:AP-4 complex accessory subunit RUSC1-like isoform 2-T3 [Discoglossus pictus]
MEESGEDSILRAKKGFLVAISSSVDKIICHFNSSRNLVQKARLGDSRLSPELGYLILNGLCPSLYDLLRDGIKPFQKDVILGRRRLSPWSLVEASVKPGTAQASFHNLLGIVKSLSQLRDPQRKFNAFIFGLLNTKKLDIWVSQLHQNYDLSSMFFVPTGFVALAAASHPELCDELLLTLQPLSALTFHLDLLFEHHHLSLPDSPVSPQPLSHGPGGLDTLGFSLQHLLHWGGRLAHNLAHGAEQNLSPTGSNHPSTLNRHVAADPSPQEFSTLQNDTPSPPSDTTHDLLSSPDRTPQDLDVSVRSLQDPSPSPLEISQDSCSPDRESPQNSLSPAIEDPQDSFPNNTQMDSSPPKELFCPSPSPLTNTSQDLLPPHSETPQDSSSSWWEHLSQASRVYMPTNIESFPFTRWSKLRSWGTSEREQENPAARGESAKATGDISKTLPEGNLPNTRKVIDPTNEHKVSDLDQSEATLSKNEGSRNTGGHLTQKNDGCTSNSDNAKTGPLSPNTGGLGMWLGHLFGANPTSSREMETKNVKSRRPSTWLQPNVNVLNLLRKPSTPVTTKTLPQEAEQPQTTKKPERSLRALCDHSSSDEAQLNFRKGEVLQLLGTVDEDWIRCQRGSDTGLVPVGYTSLIL